MTFEKSVLVPLTADETFQLTVPDALSEYVLEVASQIITLEVRAGGSFADPLEPGPDAGLLDRLIAFTGRSPNE